MTRIDQNLTCKAMTNHYSPPPFFFFNILKVFFVTEASLSLKRNQVLRTVFIEDGAVSQHLQHSNSTIKWNNAKLLF